MERQAYFQVGEEVILQSKQFPKYNGKYTVEKIFPPGPHYGPDGESLWTDQHFSYCLGFAFNWKGGICDTWQEPSIKKLHKPSETNFTELMNNLKCPA